MEELKKVIEYIEKHLILKKVTKILEEIYREKDFFLVGGTIRDIILNKEPLDFDFVVYDSGIKGAKIFEEKIKGKFILLSEKDDEARVVAYKTIFDFKGLNGKTIIDDLAERDFTINAIAFSFKEKKLIDPFKGIRDLKDKKIRLTNDFVLSQDPLRILRAIRFACQLDFKIDKKIFKKGREISLLNVAKERINYELFQILATDKSYPYIKKLYQLNLLSQIFPLNFSFFEEKNLINHSLKTYKKIEEIIKTKEFFGQFQKEWEEYFSKPHSKEVLKLAGLFHDIAKPLTIKNDEKGEVHFYGHETVGSKIMKKLLKDLKFSNDDIQHITMLIFYHMRLHLLASAPLLTDRAIRRFFRDLKDYAFGLMILTYADGYATAGYTKHLEKAIKRMIELKRKEEEEKKKIRLITGYDLIDLGLTPGPIFKKILQEIEDLYWEGKIKNKEEAISYIKENYLL
ncbi:MAG: HD domain-containing protein [candidate division WOR-3 bacterium]|nr:HD domain-containing protein [candidate division WOR-3 bacterium]MCX7836860.1 HD domain-containing protein [candidate division WOR-3 bacterium]MDW8114324.1 HD domain-containing protein [candidate division WOR-3 bacterium]